MSVWGGGGGFLARTTGHMTGGSTSRGRGSVSGGGSASGGKGMGLHSVGGGLHPIGLGRGSAYRVGRGSSSRGSAYGGGVNKPPGSAYRGRPPPPRHSEIHGILRQTVNKQVVRILLECFLVIFNKTFSSKSHYDIYYHPPKLRKGNVLS